MSQSVHVRDEVTTPLLQRQQPLREKLHALKNDFANEAVPILNMFYPLVITTGLSYLRAVISIYFLGRIGVSTLAACSLAVALVNVTANSPFSGLTAGAETICSQAIGAKRYSLFRATIWRGIILLFITCLPVLCLWINTKRILIMLKLDEKFASIAYTYMLYSTPDLVVQCFFHPLKASLKTQSKTLPLSICSAMVGVLHYPITLLFVTCLGLKVEGVVLSGVFSNFILVACLFIYITFLKEKLSSSEEEVTEESNEDKVREWKKLGGLALPSAGLVCLEWWCYEIMTIACGFLKTNSEAAFASMGILIQITSLVYILPHSLSAAVSTRVGNQLGSNRPQGARGAANVGLVLSVILGVVALTFTASVRNVWATCFTEDKTVIKLTSAVLPIVGLCELGNCPQTTMCGVLKGSARPKTGAVINAVAFYMIGLPLGTTLAFWFGFGLMGLWFAMLAAQISSGIGMVVAMYRTDWELEAERARELTSVDAGRSNGEVEDVEAEKLINGEEQSFSDG